MHFQFYPKARPVCFVCVEGVSLSGEERKVSQHVLGVQGRKLCGICGVRPSWHQAELTSGPGRLLPSTPSPVPGACALVSVGRCVAPPPQMRCSTWTRGVSRGSLPGQRLGSAPQDRAGPGGWVQVF